VHFSWRVISASRLPAKRLYRLRRCGIACEEMTRHEK